MQKGWIKIHRQIQDCSIWADNEAFDRRSAWIDLLLSATHRDKDIIFNGKPLTIKKGQYLTSVRQLAERWHWSNDRTLRFLRLLEQLGMITKESDRYRTLVTIENYDVYQSMPNTNEDTNEYTDEYTDKDTDKSQTRKEEIKRNKEDIEGAQISYQSVADLYNSICISYPKLQSLSEARKKAIKARLKTYSLEDLERAFKIAEASDFLKGKNDRNWSANFDWMMKDSNLAKILDGNYQNKEPKGNSNSFNTMIHTDYDMSELEKMLVAN